MRGKKIDNEFLGEFIQECVQLGIDSPEEMVQKAKLQIAAIDEAIREVELKKVKRSKLLDVITSFEKETKSNKVEEAKMLPFFKLSHPNICKRISEYLMKIPVNVKVLTNNELELDVLFSIKQMIECKIISKVGEHIVRGEMYEDYRTFVLQEK